MLQSHAYLDTPGHPVASIVRGVDKDVERGEDMLMLGYGLVLMAPIFAPVAPPHILLPLMALAFAVSVCRARLNFHATQKKLQSAMSLMEGYDFSSLNPILDVFAQYPTHTLTEGFNPLKNLKRTIKSILGALLVNPLWMPIFYTLCLQISEEKQLQVLNRAVLQVEQKTADWR
ncbi:MAG: hypothetical protein PHW13_05620 [Methylococcales bacterium]|nr:hypothetical protein [Methylococcales bacterium]